MKIIDEGEDISKVRSQDIKILVVNADPSLITTIFKPVNRLVFFNVRHLKSEWMRNAARGAHLFVVPNQLVGYQQPMIIAPAGLTHDIIEKILNFEKGFSFHDFSK